MTIEIRDASLEARLRKQPQATGSSSVEEVLLRLLETAFGWSSGTATDALPNHISRFVLFGFRNG